VERVRRQEQAQAADNRRRFLYSLDHELKNPLTAIRAGLANLAATLNAEAHRETLDSVEAEILRLSHLTADLRKLAELETYPLEPTSISVAELLQEVVKRAKEQPGAEERHLTLSLPQAPWPLPNILADEDLLFLAVYNLLNNSLKFTRPGDRIEVRAFEDGQSVVIVVADTGSGIPAEETPHVWEELYRGQEARAAPGSGLGLALVKAIIHRHGGRVTLRSQIEHGTEVRVELPAA
jgi:two-component system OmpR family sensor kinase